MKTKEKKPKEVNSFRIRLTWKTSDDIGNVSSFTMSEIYLK